MKLDHVLLNNPLPSFRPLTLPPLQHTDSNFIDERLFSELYLNISFCMA